MYLRLTKHITYEVNIAPHCDGETESKKENMLFVEAIEREFEKKKT